MGREKPDLTIGLAGNPNCGKTTLFNALTGERLKTANWPGVTVERMEGTAVYEGKTVHIVDLPGIYSLNSYTMEEQITRACLEGTELDLVINVADASSLERNLYLTLQLVNSNKPVILALNMIDIAKRRGIVIHTERLSQMLGGIPVVPVSARKRDGLARLMWESFYISRPSQDGKGNHSFADKKSSDKKGYNYIEQILSECIETKKGSTRDFGLDHIMTHPIWGIPALLLVMVFVFLLTFFVGDFLKGYLETGLVSVSRFVGTALIRAHASDWMVSLMVDGILTGVGGVLTFLPNLFMLFLALAVLEDSGYMARAAYVMNEIMGMAGLSGRAFLPLLLGFGCSVPAVMASRTLESMRDKRRTIALIPFMSCSARLPIYVLFSGMFFPGHAAFVTLSLYAAGATAAFLTACLFRAADMKEARDGSGALLMELPEYRLPDLETVLLSVWEREKEYLFKAGTTICSAAILLWAALHTGPEGFCAELSESYAACLGGVLVPVLRPAGLGSWQTAVALISGLTAKEVVVSSFFVLYGIQNSAAAFGADRLAAVLRETGFGAANACALMVFCLLYPPCMAALSVIKKETDSFLWTAGMILLQLVLAWAAAASVFQIGCLLA